MTRLWKILAAAAACALLVTPAMADDYSVVTAIKQNCANEWPDDYRMQASCFKQNAEALAWLSDRLPEIKAAGADQPPSRILAACMDKWVEGDGHEWTMVKYCWTTQMQAYRAIQALPGN